MEEKREQNRNLKHELSEQQKLVDTLRAKVSELTQWYIEAKQEVEENSDVILKTKRVSYGSIFVELK